MSIFRSDQAFFHVRQTHTMIDRVSQWSNIVIYVGSGATIDRTGYTWVALVDKFLEKQRVSEPVRRMASSHLDPAAAASAIKSGIANIHGSSTDDALRRQMGEVLYEHSKYFGGQLVNAIGQLALTMVSQGKSVVIVTPNYDAYVSHAIDELKAQLSLSHNLDVADWTDPVQLIPKKNRTAKRVARELTQRGSIRVVHFHGYVPEKATFPVAPDASLVFSEEDYERTRVATDRLLFPLLRTQNLLVVGAGMTDPPLIRALIRTKQVRVANGVSSLCLLTQQGLFRDAYGMSSGERAAFLQILTRRLDHLGIKEKAFPDFYYQNAQFLQELLVASQLSGKYSESTARYGQRLVKWWQSWSRNSGVDERRSDLRNIKAELQRLAQVLGSMDVLDLEAQIWLRWRPDSVTGMREMKCWISSNETTYTSAEPDEVSAAAIAASSDPATSDQMAVSAVFCAGRQLSGVSGGIAWAGSLIYTSDSAFNSKVPVGVIILKGKRENWPDTIGLGQGNTRLSLALTVFEDFAETIISRHLT